MRVLIRRTIEGIVLIAGLLFISCTGGQAHGSSGSLPGDIKAQLSLYDWTRVLVSNAKDFDRTVNKIGFVHTMSGDTALEDGSYRHYEKYALVNPAATACSLSRLTDDSGKSNLILLFSSGSSYYDHLKTVAGLCSRYFSPRRSGHSLGVCYLNEYYTYFDTGITNGRTEYRVDIMKADQPLSW